MGLFSEHMNTKKKIITKNKKQWINHEIKGNLKYLDTQNNENTAITNIWGAAKAVLRGKFMLNFLKR